MQELIFTMKNVLIISTSLRAHSNSDALAAAFAEGAKSAGHAVETISLKGKEIRFCTACYACRKTGRCVAPDDAPAIISKIQAADVVAFATPIYFYEMSGQLKTLLDRTVSIYSAPYKFRDIYLLATAAEDEAATPERAFNGLGGWVECFEQARVAGQVFAGGVYEQNTIAGHPALEAARHMGSQV